MTSTNGLSTEGRMDTHKDIQNLSVPELDVDAIRKDFPILQTTIHGKPLIYLDNAASSQKPISVIEAISNYYSREHSNVHRGIHHLSQQATEQYEQAREKVANFIGAKHTREIIWTRGATEAINLVAYSWGQNNLKQGDDLIISTCEHHSNIVPWQLICELTGATLRHLPLDSHDKSFNLNKLAEMLTPNTRMIALTHMSNVLGTITDLRKVVELARQNGSLVLADGAQSVPHIPVDVEELGVDFLAFSGHKMLGPTGIGCLYGREELLEDMPPYQGGGDMIETVTMKQSTWNQLPYKFEAGTPNIAGAIGLGASVDYLEHLGMESVRAHSHKLNAYAIAALSEIDQISIYGPRTPSVRGGVFSFNYADIHPHDLGQVLDSKGVAIRAGHHCAQPLMAELGVGSTARASFYLYNTQSEIDELCAAIRSTGEFFLN